MRSIIRIVGQASTGRLRRISLCRTMTSCVLIWGWLTGVASAQIGNIDPGRSVDESPRIVKASLDQMKPVDVTPAWYEIAAPDQSDWSPKRKAGYAHVQTIPAEEPAALLRIPALELAVPVFADTQKLTLERGAGWVMGTALPGEPGNMAIAGHRDSYFRPLERIEPGALILLRTPTGEDRYRVASISVVDALDTSVLEPTATNVLTLITCYPFRFRGFAPDRYIVRAEFEVATTASPSGQSSLPYALAKP